MNRLWEKSLIKADQSLADDLSNQHEIFRHLPLEIYGELLLGVPDQYPRLKRLLPAMASDEVQKSWTGDCGIAMLNKGIPFVRTVMQYANGAESSLDYGCGYGRLLRLFGKYFPVRDLEGVDPWDKSLEICRECGIRNPLSLSDYLPEALPVNHGAFDLIYAYSVFTHLSPSAFARSIRTLRRYISPEGVLAITVRPVEYWEYFQNADAISTHLRQGYAYIPHNFHVRDEDGVPVYGDMSIDLEFLGTFSEWVIEAVEVSYTDPFQTMLILRPS